MKEEVKDSLGLNAEKEMDDVPFVRSLVGNASCFFIFFLFFLKSIILRALQLMRNHPSPDGAKSDNDIKIFKD